jgi:hypothetical protein
LLVRLLRELRLDPAVNRRNLLDVITHICASSAPHHVGDRVRYIGVKGSMGLFPGTLPAQGYTTSVSPIKSALRATIGPILRQTRKRKGRWATYKWSGAYLSF